MEVFVKTAGIAVTAALIGLSIKKDVPQLAFVLSLCTGVFILGSCIGTFSEVAETFRRIMEESQTDIAIFSPLIKICCLSAAEKIICEICRDAGERALAEKLSLFSKAAQLSVLMPLLSQVLGTISEICSKI